MKCPHCHEEIAGWATVSAIMPAAALDTLNEAVDALREEGFELPSNRRLAKGLALEALAASYLASARTARQALLEQRTQGGSQ